MKTTATIADLMAPDQQFIDEVYARRAQRLAERLAERTDAHGVPALVFRLGAERYAIELTELVEVFPYRGCTTVPGAPSTLLGVINVRGDIRPVADLRQILQLPPQEADAGATPYVVMIRQPGGATGLTVDAIEGVREIDPGELVPAVGSATPTGSRFVKALTPDTVIVLDAAAALASVTNQ